MRSIGRTSPPRVATFWLVGGLLVAACSDSTPSANVSFSMPLGVAVAGTDGRDLFIAQGGESSLSVVEMGESLRKHDWVPSAAQYFPLRIPAGARPEEMVATEDGKFLVVLDTLYDELYLIDAVGRQQVVDDAGEPVRLSLAGSGARSLIRTATQCPATPAVPCHGPFYVALADVGAVLTIEIHEGAVDGTATLVAGRLYAVGGEPGHLAMSAKAPWLFAADASTNEVVRLDLDSGVVDRTDVGAVAGPLGVSTDGQLLVVSRPVWRDVIVLRGLDNAQLELVDADAPATPALGCLRRCDDVDPTSCAQAHPADRALCSADDGLHSAGTYPGLYLGGVPAAVVMVGTEGGYAPINVSCTKTDPANPGDTLTESQSHNELALVITHPGTQTSATVHFIVLDAAGATRAVAALANSKHCYDPPAGVHVTDGAGVTAVGLHSYLDLAPLAPTDRSSFVLPEVVDANGEPIPSSPDFGRLRLRPGVGASGTWQFEWEPKLVDHDTGGSIAGDGTFSDGDTDFASVGVQAGDYLEILSPALARIEGCRAGLPAAYGTGTETHACGLERRIAGVSDDGRKLTFATPLPEACFSSGSIAYRVRVGNAFMLSAGAQKPRIAPAERFGAGGEVGERSRAMFKLQDLGFDRDTSAPWDACSWYDDTGGALQGHDSLLSRGPVFGFTTSDGFAPVVAGEGPAGYLPSAAVVAPLTLETWGTGIDANMPPVFVSYAGSALVLGLIPYDTGKLGDADRQVVLK
ncbi:MAG: hypothetical protein AAB426_03090 [Myxococcota bacterium]